jgi:hypothetical protein
LRVSIKTIGEPDGDSAKAQAKARALMTPANDGNSKFGLMPPNRSERTSPLSCSRALAVNHQ